MLQFKITFPNSTSKSQSVVTFQIQVTKIELTDKVLLLPEFNYGLWLYVGAGQTQVMFGVSNLEQ